MRQRSKSTTFRLATFQQRQGPLSKTIELGDEGRISNADDCKMASGTVKNTAFEGVAGLAMLIDGMASDSALSLGAVIRLEDGAVLLVRAKDKPRGFDGVIARDKDHMHFEAGQPGFLLVDFDQKGMPDEVGQRIDEAGGVFVP